MYASCEWKLTLTHGHIDHPEICRSCGWNTPWGVSVSRAIMFAALFFGIGSACDRERGTQGSTFLVLFHMNKPNMNDDGHQAFRHTVLCEKNVDFIT